MVSAVDELWSVARGSVHVDADALSRAVERASATRDEPLDYRTRLLIRDSLRALRAHWGDSQFAAWLSRSPQHDDIHRVCDNPATRDARVDEGFPTLERRLVTPIEPDVVLTLLRELADHVARPTELMIGRSIALTLSGHLSRTTDDMDIVDELPAAVREQPALLENLAQRYGLRLAHFQSHYLPEGWQKRVRSVGAFGKLQVFAVDPYDVIVGKLFSAREKDRDDLRAVTPKLERAVLEDRLRRTTVDLRSEPRLLDAANRNWFILFGQDLPA
jgi:hypothetical protein